VLIQITKDVEGGKSFSDALGKHKVFSSLYINMVKASELSGSFAQMLERLVDYLNQQMETRSMVVGAMIYPGVIATMAVGTTTFLLTFVVPRFVMVFKGHEKLLPLPTKILLFLSHFVCTYWYFLLMALAAGIWAFFTIIRTPGGRLWFDKMKLTVPIFKRMFRALYITRSLHTMGELVNAGVPMPR
jgi:type IV pilus assembly protein PilC